MLAQIIQVGKKPNNNQPPELPDFKEPEYPVRKEAASAASPLPEASAQQTLVPHS